MGNASNPELVGTPSGRSQGKKRGPRGDVTGRTLLNAADTLTRRYGPTALTQRRITAEAGVSPNVLYTYFEDVEDVRIQLADIFLSRVDTALLAHGDPAGALFTFLQHVRTLFANNHGYADLLALQRVAGPHALALNEALLDFFTQRVGHPFEVAVDITWLLTDWLYGNAQLAGESATPGFIRAMSRQQLSRYPLTSKMRRPRDDHALKLMARALTTS